MKTTLIQLDENDDILSIKDKMQWNSSQRILLVIPHNNKCIHRCIDIVLLQRVAQKNGSQFAISTSQRYLHGLGKLTGVKVFSTVLAAQKQVWPEIPEGVQRPKSHTRKESFQIKEYLANRKREKLIPSWQKFLFFSLGALTPLALVLILVPHATISLYPAQTVQKLNLDFTASPAFSMASVEGKLPAYPQAMTLSAIESIPTTGQTNIPDQFAKGSIRITNLTENNIYLPAHSRLYIDGFPNLQFQTLSEVKIPAGKGQFVDVPILSITAGEVGNLPPLSINSIAEPFGALLQVANLTSISGGTDILVKAVSAQDIQLLKSKISQRLQSEALINTESLSAKGEQAVPKSLILVSETINTNLNIGDPGDQLTMEMTANYQFMAIRQDEINQLASTYATISIPPGYQQVAGSLHMNTPVITSFETDNQLIHGQIGISQLIQSSMDRNKLTSAILGKTRKQALKTIESYVAMVQPPTITLSPAFWFWIPLIPGQIEINNPGVQ
jgi:hypothetical protein